MYAGFLYDIKQNPYREFTLEFLKLLCCYLHTNVDLLYLFSLGRWEPNALISLSARMPGAHSLLFWLLIIIGSSFLAYYL